MLLSKRKGLFETGRVSFIAVSDILPNPNQPRVRFSNESLLELAGSIKEHGILQPLSVRKVSGHYELVSGERRLRSAKLAGLTHVPCLLVQITEQTSSVLALIENIQRKDLDFLEEATALQLLIQTYHLSQEQVAKQIGKSQSAVANKLRLLKLDPSILADLLTHNLTERHGRALLKLPNQQSQLLALEYIIAHQLTVAKSEQYIDALLAPLSKAEKRKPTRLLKDVRLFLNTINRSLTIIQESGVAVECQRKDLDDTIQLTISIPK